MKADTKFADQCEKIAEKAARKIDCIAPNFNIVILGAMLEVLKLSHRRSKLSRKGGVR